MKITLKNKVESNFIWHHLRKCDGCQGYIINKLMYSKRFSKSIELFVCTKCAPSKLDANILLNKLVRPMQ